MKKLVKVLLAISMCVGLFGCGPKQETTKDPKLDYLTTWHTYETQAREIQTWNILYSQASVDLSVLSNCLDSLLTQDKKARLQPCIATDWHTNEDATEWTFKLRKDVKWVDYKGEVKAELTSQDFVTALEWVLNYSKNQGANTSMPIEMIKGAKEYYEMTAKEFEETGAVSAETEAKFAEIVGVSAPDEVTLVYTMLAPKPYFDTCTTYACLYPLAQGAVDEYGDQFGTNNETIWYCGPYVCNEYENNSYKTLTRNIKWHNTIDKTFESVHIQMVEDQSTAWSLFQSGEIDNITLAEDALLEIYKQGESNEYYKYLVEAIPSFTMSYVLHFNYDSKLEDGQLDTNWNTAIANKNFRLAWYYGIDWTPFLKRYNNINPGNCIVDAYTADNIAFTSTGKDYTQLVKDELGYETQIAPDAVHARYNPGKFAEVKEAAIKELTAQGVTFPVNCYYFYKAGDGTAADTAKVFQQMVEEQLDGLVKVEFRTYSESAAQEIRKPDLFSVTIGGWGADYGDPIDYIGQESDRPNAFYNAQYSNLTAEIDPEYGKFIQALNAADELTVLDDRYVAFAKAEAMFIENAWAIPLYKNIPWQITRANDASKIHGAYGNQYFRYVNWKTTTNTAYTAEEYAEFK